MNIKEKKDKLFILRYHMTMASALADELFNGNTIGAEQSGDLRRRCEKAMAAAQSFDNYCRGIEPPKVG